jgi:hypothetical protein
VALGARWQPYVSKSLEAERQYDGIVSGTRRGPVQARLSELQQHLHRSISDLVAAATRADEIERTLANVDADAVTAAYKQARRAADAASETSSEVPEHLRERAELLGQQHATVQRLLNLVDTAEETLAGLQLRVDQIVVRGLDVAVRANRPDDVTDLNSQLVELDEALSALRAGLDAVG